MNIMLSSKFRIFLLLTSLYLLLHFSITYLFASLDIYLQTFQEQLSANRIEKLFEIANNKQWITYVIIPVIVFIRVLYTSIFLYTGAFFSEIKLEFGKLMEICLLADFVFVLSSLTKLIILIFFKQVNTLEDLQFIPLSILDLLNKDNIDSLFIYPLSLVNLFQISYLIVLAYLLTNLLNHPHSESSIKFEKSFKLVTISYGSGLFLWCLLITFVSLNIE